VYVLQHGPRALQHGGRSFGLPTVAALTATNPQIDPTGCRGGSSAHVGETVVASVAELEPAGLRLAR